MPVSDALKRLLRIRDLEQEQHRVAFSSALAELRAIEQALSTALQREKTGRASFAASIRSGELVTRHSSLVESAIGEQHRAAFVPALSRAAAEAARRHQAFLLKRVEHRQAETLIQEAEAADAIEAMRHGQQSLDDWFLSRTLRNPRGTETLEDSDPPEPTEEFSNSPSVHPAQSATRMKAVQE